MVKVRFAPSPTGLLHIGNVRTALFNYLFSKHENGKFVLRIEDTDRDRSKPEYEKAIQEDLKWLGFTWDEGSTRQSERGKLYTSVLEKLEAGGHVYRCFCSQQELEEKRKKCMKEKRPPRYDGKCRDLSRDAQNKQVAQGAPYTYRFKIQDPLVKFQDLIKGNISVNLNDMVGDFVLARQDKSPTFHLAVCVDDAEMHITHVIRGEDHLSNTPRHILIFKALGAPVPQFAHMPLILGEGGEPLSKRLGHFSIQEFRKQGTLSDGIINYLALLGWSPGDDREIFTREELIHAFSLDRVNTSPARFNREKMKWVLHEHFQKIESTNLEKGARFFLGETVASLFSSEDLTSRLQLLQDGAATYQELANKFESIFAQKESELDSEAKQVAGEESFKSVVQVLKKKVEESEEKYLRDVNEYVQVLKPLGLKGAKLFKPLRLILTGSVHGPELKQLLPLLPRQTALWHVERWEQRVK